MTLSHIWSTVCSSVTIRRIAKVYLGDIISKAMMLVSALLLIRILSVEEYAWFIAFYSVALLFSNLIGNSINVALVRFSAEIFSRTGIRPVGLYRTALGLETLIYTVALVVGCIFASEIGSLMFGQAAYQWPIILGLLSGMSLLFINATRSFYQAEERFNPYVLTLWLRQALNLAVVVALWRVGSLTFINAAVGMIVVDSLVGLSLLFTSLRKSQASAVQDKTISLRGFLTASGWLVAYFLALAAFERLDVMMLSHLTNESELATYGVAFRYYSMAMLTLGSISVVLRPKFSRSEMLDYGRQISFVNRWLKYSIWVVIPIALFDLLGEPLFLWLNGGRYVEAFPIWVIFSIGVWIALVCSPLANILISRKMFRTLLTLGCIAFVVDLTMNWILIPLYGGMGAAIATVGAVSFINIACFVLVRFRRY